MVMLGILWLLLFVSFSWLIQLRRQLRPDSGSERYELLKRGSFGGGHELMLDGCGKTLAGAFPPTTCLRLFKAEFRSNWIVLRYWLGVSGKSRFRSCIPMTAASGNTPGGMVSDMKS